MACTTAAYGATYLGAPCPDCGHTSLTHPGPSNPALTECALCQLAELIEPTPVAPPPEPVPDYDQVS